MLAAYLVTVTRILDGSRECSERIYKMVIKLDIFVNDATSLLMSYFLP